MIKFLIPGVAIATILLFCGFWSAAALFSVLYLAVLEVLRGILAWNRRFALVESLRRSREALRASLAKIKGGGDGDI